MQIRTVEEAARWLLSLVDVEKERRPARRRFSLDPIRALCARLGDPQEDLRALHVAGSKGKGSTALFAEAVLRAAGERVGVFTSPHLLRWTERFRVDGREAEGAQVARAVDAVRPHVEALRRERPGAPPTFFDATTAAAFLLFREAGVARVILEVGLGGRLDSTNVCRPAVTCITAIEREHTEILGETPAAIAGEKAGIWKEGVPAVVGALPEAALAVVEARARALGAPLARLGRDFTAEVREAGAEGLCVHLADGPVEVDVRLPVLGAHQAGNAALALACVRRLDAHADAALREAARRGLCAAVLPGRVELLRRAPPVVVDSAHTGASAAALARALEAVPRRRTHLVLSVSAGKDLPAILGELLPLASRVTVTRAEPHRSLAPQEVAAAVRRAAPAADLRVVPNPHLALRAAAEAQGDDELLLAAGSVYLAGLAREVWARLPEPGRVAVTRSGGRAPAPPAGGDVGGSGR